jgi:hypothetical protein
LFCGRLGRRSYAGLWGRLGRRSDTRFWDWLLGGLGRRSDTKLWDWLLSGLGRRSDTRLLSGLRRSRWFTIRTCGITKRPHVFAISLEKSCAVNGAERETVA